MENLDRAQQRRGVRLALNTQTPLIRFRDEAVASAGDGPVDLSRLDPQQDYKFTTGGVTRMVLPLLKQWLASGRLASAEWVAMAAGEHAPRLSHKGVELSFVSLSVEQRRLYAMAKERLWTLLNTNPGDPPVARAPVPPTALEAFDAYQQASARALEQAGERMGGIDLLYVHDFQQVGVARAWAASRVPRVFHLHTPFPAQMPAEWSGVLLDAMEAYDRVIVSTQRYARNLRSVGLTTPVDVVYPFIDPEDYRHASQEEIDAFRRAYDIAPADRVILNVGRMDPMKAQDRILRALPSVLDEMPEARALLVGNGSFSSSRNGGLGLSKGGQWRTHLESLAKELGVSDRVTFTGHLDEALLPMAYGACDVFCLPSTREGFGLAAIEAWRYARPVVVGDRAGVSELVVDGENGHVVDAGAPDALAEALLDPLLRPERARAMGEAGLSASEKATLPQGRRSLERIFSSLVEREIRA